MTEDEISEHMAEICLYFRMNAPNVKKILRAADISKTGRIDYDEFLVAAYDKKKLLTPENLRKAFNMFDRQGKGSITKTDIMTIMQASNPCAVAQVNDIWNALVSQVNLDENDGISYEEFEGHMCDVMQKKASLYAMQRA